MKQFNNVNDLRSEIARLKEKVRMQEKDIKENVLDLRESLRPQSLLLSLVSSWLGLRISRSDFLKDGLGSDLAVLLQKLILKAERKVENKTYDFIDALLDRLRMFMEKFTGQKAKRSERREESDSY